MDYQALDALPEAVLVVAPDGSVVHCNDRAGMLLGLSDDAVGQPIEAVLNLTNDDGEPCRPLIPERTGDRLAEHVYTAVLADDQKRQLARAGRWLGDGTLVMTFRPVRGEQSSAAAELVATVSHEIRSPLTSVKGFTRTLLAKWDRFSDEQKKTMLETINADADRVTRLLTELLDVSRIDAGRVQLHIQLVDVAGLITELVERARTWPQAQEREINLNLADIPSTLADPDKLTQSLSNLLENALKYAPESKVDISASVVDGHIEVRVHDAGPGIPEAQRERVFEKFGRGEKSKLAGTGLGLYLARGLVEAHGGTVDCESSAELGTTFTVELPVRDVGSLSDVGG